MSDYNSALYFAREAAIKYQKSGKCWDAEDAAQRLIGLIAALDDARGEAVVWVDRRELVAIRPHFNMRAVLYGRDFGEDAVPLYAAPPDVGGVDWEAVAADQAMTIAMLRADLLEARQAQRPAALAVPACPTCRGVGMVGGSVGQTAESFDWVSEPCPDCN